MLTFTIGNVSSDDVLLATSGTKDFVVQLGDLNKVQDNHSGFTACDLLQQLRQSNLITVNIADLGDDEDSGSICDEAYAVAA